MNNVEKVIAVADAEVGYLEKRTNSQLDSKTANAGSANYTKYARDLDNIKGFFNGAKNGHPWCSVFVSWCFVKAYGAAAAKSLLCQPATNSYAAGCMQAVKYFKNKKQFYKTPKVGDQIFFLDSAGDAAHTGLVYKVDGSRVYTIEGNTSSASGVVANGGSVAYKSYPLNYSRICGYGRPKYDVAASTTATTTKAASTSQINMPTIRKGDVDRGKTYGAVHTLQRLLRQLNYYNVDGKSLITVDGDFGSNTEAALIRWQKNNLSSADGICGKKTWNKILKG